MSLKHALLGLLAKGPSSGYELTKEFELSLANVWSAKHSQIYPELRKMADTGWLTVGAEGARGRKEYAITEEGRSELRRWLVEDEPDRVGRSEWMLRIFFLWTLSPTEAAEYLDDEVAAAHRAIEHLESIDSYVPWDETGSDQMGRIALEWGMRSARCQADWARWAAAQVRAGHDATTLDQRQDS